MQVTYFFTGLIRARGMMSDNPENPEAETYLATAEKGQRRITKDVVTAIEKICVPIAGVIMAGGWFVVKSHSVFSGIFLIVTALSLLFYMGFIHFKHNVQQIEYLDNKILLVLSICICIFIFSSIFTYVYYPNLPDETETHGWLLPSNEATPDNGCSRQVKEGRLQDGLVVLIGSLAFLSPLENKKFTALEIGSCPVVSITKSADGILLDVDDYDVTGDLAFRVKSNEIHVIHGPVSYTSRSSDRSQIQIYDKKGKELLNVKYLNKNAVSIEGVFGCEHHDLVTIKGNLISDSQGPLDELPGLCISGYFTESAIKIR